MSVRRMVSGLLLMVVLLIQLAVLMGGPQYFLAGRAAPGLETVWHQWIVGPAPWLVGASGAASLVLGTLSALALWRLRGSRTSLTWGLLAPLLLPLTVWGATAGGPTGLGLLLIGHVSLGLAIGGGCGLVSLGQVDPGLLRAAASCGVTPGEAFRRVVLPLIAPGILAGLLLSVAASIGGSLILSYAGAVSWADIVAALAALWPMPQPLPRPQWLAVVGLIVLAQAVIGAAMALLRPR